MKAGFGTQVITPPWSMPMDGYGSRTEISQGVHSPLYARAVVFEQGAAILLLVLDILAVDGDLVREIRAEVKEKTGIPEQQIMVAATHTHAGPRGCREHALGREGLDRWEPYRRFLAEQAASAALLAYQDKQEANLKSCRVEKRLFASNRRIEGGCVDHQLTVLVVERDAQPLGVLFSYPCHPTILDAKNLLISPEFPGYAVQHIQRQFPNALFFNGAAGDISTRFTRRSSSFAEAQARGAELGEAVLNAIQEAEPLSVSTVGGQCRTIELPVQTRDLDRAEAQVKAASAAYAAAEKQASPQELRQLEVNLIGAQKACKLAASQTRKSIATEIQFLELGPIKFVSIPGELFCSIGRQIKALAAGIEIVGYANDYIGYIPSEDAFQQGGYELFSSLVGPRAGMVIIDSIRSMGGF